jgi:hypothetical protein
LSLVAGSRFGNIDSSFFKLLHQRPGFLLQLGDLPLQVSLVAFKPIFRCNSRFFLSPALCAVVGEQATNRHQQRDEPRGNCDEDCQQVEVTGLLGLPQTQVGNSLVLRIQLGGGHFFEHGRVFFQAAHLVLQLVDVSNGLG